MWITWQQGVALSALCGLVWAVLATVTGPGETTRGRRFGHGVGTVCGEVAVVAALFSLWQYVFALTVTQTAGAMDHARWIYDIEGRVGLPDELTIQQWSMSWTWLIRFLNWYYAYLHIPTLGVLLVWLFFWHRDRYGRIRNLLALATGACLAIQSIPVAPPRFLAELGFVDTGLVYGQSVYGEGGSGLSNQLAAMPSVHVLWAVLIAYAVVTVASGPWRWLVLIHPTMTTWAVVATANHWWADGIVAAVVLAVAAAVLAGLAYLWRRVAPDATEPGHQDRVPADPAGSHPPGGLQDQLSRF